MGATTPRTPGSSKPEALRNGVEELKNLEKFNTPGLSANLDSYIESVLFSWLSGRQPWELTKFIGSDCMHAGATSKFACTTSQRWRVASGHEGVSPGLL